MDVGALDPHDLDRWEKCQKKCHEIDESIEDMKRVMQKKEKLTLVILVFLVHETSR